MITITVGQDRILIKEVAGFQPKLSRYERISMILVSKVLVSMWVSLSTRKQHLTLHFGSLETYHRAKRTKNVEELITHLVLDLDRRLVVSL